MGRRVKGGKERNQKKNNVEKGRGNRRAWMGEGKLYDGDRRGEREDLQDYTASNDDL